MLGFPRPLLLGAATAAPLSCTPHRALPGTPVFLHPHTARHGPSDTHTVLGIRGREGGRRAAYAQTGLPGRGTNRRACDVTAGRATCLAPAGLETGREGRGGTRETASTDQTWARGARGFTWAPSCLQARPTHVHTLTQLTSTFADVHRHLSLEHTHPHLQHPHGCSHTPAPTHTLTQSPLESLHTSVSYTHTRVCHPPLHPTLAPRHPCEPAPALLSTRDWPTRIRMLDARMDRQKFSKMMERSDFMNLGVAWGDTVGTDRKASCRAQPGVARHLLPHPYPPPSHLPPEGGVDGKQGEQCHAGHSTADHKGDRGGPRQLQGLG